MQHLNIEIKAKHNNIAFVRQYLHAHNAQFIGTDHQIDTYFNTQTGRLKLRQGNIENALIHYDRANDAGPKKSVVTMMPVQDSEKLKAILQISNGIKVVVDKQREIYFIDNVKFHIDEVQSLGGFVEIEAIDKDGTIGIALLQKQCADYITALQIEESNLMQHSYSDMLMEKYKRM
jgi:adenylate cyclase, class 2